MSPDRRPSTARLIALTVVMLASIGIVLKVVERFLRVGPPAPRISAEPGPIPVDLPGPQVVDAPAGAAVVLFEDDHWRLVRYVRSGYLDVFRRDRVESDWHLVLLSLHWRKNTVPLAAAANALGLYIVGYDAVANVPSGRSTEVSRSGIDVFLVSGSMAKERPTCLAAALPLGGFDTTFQAHALPDGLVVSGAGQVVTIRGMAPPRFWDVEAMKGREFVEVRFEGERAAAIVRPSHDDRSDGPLDDDHATYELALLDPGGMSITPVQPDGLPWRVRIGDQGPLCEYARTPEELVAVFLYDLGRMAFGGILDFGGNNLEGRVAWSQTYYLDALVEIRQGRVANLPFTDARSLKARVADELDLLAGVVLSQWPGLLCQRCSVDREPVLFALHVGRTLELLAKAERLPDMDGRLGTAIDALRRTATDLSSTIETPGEWTDGDTSFRSLGYRKQVPFWADGCNVPFNYVSGVVAGLLAADSTAGTADRCGEWMRPLLDLEFNGKLPRTWRYWWGTGDRGWTPKDGVSLNTPEYVGNGGSLAHISYRSMDASALLALGRSRPRRLPDGLTEHLHALVASGWLLPWVAGAFSEDHPRPAMLPEVVRRYARSSAAWELQAQVWALDQLAGEYRRD